MSRVATEQRLASAFVVFCGHYGDVSRHAQQTGLSRQGVYGQAQRVAAQIDGHQHRDELACLHQRLQDLTQQVATLQRQLHHAVVLDEHQQAAFAIVGQAIGVSLPECRELLEVLIPGRSLSVATLGRRTQAAGAKAGQLLAVLDEEVRSHVRQAAADEIYVSAPVLMTVEPDSLCWVSGQLRDQVTGEVWAEEFRQWPNLEQLTRDGGSALAKGVAVVNGERHEHGQRPLVDQGDHYHALRGGGSGLRHAEVRAGKALAAAETAQAQLEVCQRQGQDARGASQRARAAWQRAEAALDQWTALDRAWQRTKQALRLVTPAGELNTRARAEAVLAETLPLLPDGAFAKVKRSLGKPEMLNFLDRVQEQIAAVPVDRDVKEAAVCAECLRRCPEVLRGEGARAAAQRGVLLVCAVVLNKAGTAGAQAQTAVGEILRRAQRASSLVECINSVLRMQQARHRKLTQGLLDLKRLYWNSHVFRSGRRRKTSPYQRLGVPWPPGVRWLDVLAWTPEQLRDQLSTAKKAA